jgi:8-oxo-dGTP diphosphatase
MPGKPFMLSCKVLVRNGRGECLMLKRSAASKNNKGKWDFPGGKVDPGERFDEALLREVAEETGLDVTLDGVAGTAESDLPDRRVVYLIMAGHARGTEVTLSEEHDACTWVAVRELPAMDLCPQFGRFVEGLVGSFGR